MNREIKFRAWNLELKHMVFPTLEFGRELWPCTYKRTTKTIDKDGYTEEIVLEFVSVDHILQDPIFEVMQFTGLYDVDDNEIYEGDIVVPVKFKEIPNVIQYIQNGFYLVKSINNKIYANLLGNCDIKIIGNIHKNPELISYKIN
jgi:hypothetical protein